MLDCREIEPKHGDGDHNEAAKNPAQNGFVGTVHQPGMKALLHGGRLRHGDTLFVSVPRRWQRGDIFVGRRRFGVALRPDQSQLRCVGVSGQLRFSLHLKGHGQP